MAGEDCPYKGLNESLNRSCTEANPCPQCSMDEDMEKYTSFYQALGGTWDGTRNPDRIPVVLDAIEAHWEDHPDLRLGQLICNLADGDPFGMEDDDLLAELGEELEMEYYVEGGDG